MLRFSSVIEAEYPVPPTVTSEGNVTAVPAPTPATAAAGSNARQTSHAETITVMHRRTRTVGARTFVRRRFEIGMSHLSAAPAGF